MTDVPPLAAIAHRDARFVEVCGHRLEYVDIPAHQTRRPPLIFMHEGLGSVSMWREFPAAVARRTGCRTIVYSRYGFGRSSPRPAPYTPRFMHEEALAILPALRDALGVSGAVLIGHSTGASMALIHASQPQADVRGVVAMAPLIFVEASNVASIRHAKWLYLTTNMREKLMRHHDDAEAVFMGWHDIWIHPDFRTWSIEADLAGIHCQVLAILGDDDEYSTPAQIAALERGAVNVASFDYLKLADCRHAPHRDQPEVVLDAIARFVEETD